MPSSSWSAEPQALGLRVSAGFEVTRFADDALAHDIYAMTIDAFGRVVVSGAGYVRTLVDSDSDGVADRFTTYVAGPKTGAEGMQFVGRDLYCVGDAGFIRYRDDDGDDVADGPADTLLAIKTGGEHGAHAVRIGPDGYWYLMAGNAAGVTDEMINNGWSPVRRVRAGALLRISPDFANVEVVADGFRNVYDFDFDQRGELFAFDSDGEREVSLPWYLPTRLFHVVPGGDHGWASESCKRPNYLLDSAPVVAALGRGSPTGVVCYRHEQFPEAYRGGLFLADWTFGRVLYVPLERVGGGFAPQEARPFITASGEAGFAPTDLEVGRDGSLYVSVGGRGTQGAVYRVTWKGAAGGTESSQPPLAAVDEQLTNDQAVVACVAALQPESSWARSRWLPRALRVGAGQFLSFVVDERQSEAVRIRAVEILTSSFSGLPVATAELLGKSKSAELRGAVAWSLGVRPPADLPAATWRPFLEDPAACVRRRALEALRRWDGDAIPLISTIARVLNDDDRLVRVSAARMRADFESSLLKDVVEAGGKAGRNGAAAAALVTIWREGRPPGKVDSGALAQALCVLQESRDTPQKLEATRVLQLALGDVGPRPKVAAAFHGYTPMLDLSNVAEQLGPVRATVAGAFSSAERPLDLELARLAGMLEATDEVLAEKILAKIASDSPVVDDIHYLLVLACMRAPPNAERTGRLAAAFVDLDRKIARESLQQERHWNDRVGEAFVALCTQYKDLPRILVGRSDFGRPGHTLFLTRLPEAVRREGLEAFTRAIREQREYPWNSELVLALGRGNSPGDLSLIREQFERFDLRNAVLLVLAQNPVEEDRERFCAGLDSGAFEAVQSCLSALEKLPARENPVELVTLVKLMRRLGTDKNEFVLRERVARLLERNTGESFAFVYGKAGYEPQPEAIKAWTDYVSRKFPDEAAQRLGEGGADVESLRRRLAAIPWERGAPERGQVLFVKRGCGQCHGGVRGTGPDLAGAAGRFSLADLFIAIALPNRDVSPRYQTLLVETKAGKIHSGVVVYESVDGLLIRNGTGQTVRIEGDDIEARRALPTSLMPEGLLQGLDNDDLADLYAYLKSPGQP